MESLGIYIQVPFCESKCSFCNFSSRVAPSAVFDGYTRALVQEVRRLSDIYTGAGIALRVLALPVDTLYVGGGTPTVLGFERLSEIIGSVRVAFHVADPNEFTLEVTPGSADERALRELRLRGVNRLSIGAQAFNDQELRSVGRLHTADDTKRMFAEARRAGFANINLDLIAALPHQTSRSWQATLETVAQLRPEHVSLYIFEVDEKSRLGGEVIRHGTRFHAGAVPDEDFAADSYEKGRAFLRGEGYSQYEISNFSLPAFESQHNRKYWRREPYLGLGAGAHSFDGERRWSNEVSPANYQTRLEAGESPVEQVSQLSLDEQLEEFFFLGLRQAEGIDLSLAKRHWGIQPMARWKRTIEDLTERGWLENQAGNLRLADAAYLISNEVFQEFLG
jgi:oxygen-independent coproporphyrinogen-3 oxidase